MPSEHNELRSAVLAYRESLWRQWEAEVAPGPYSLGEQFSALDIYFGAMSRWRPGRAWFETECPKLWGIACRVDEESDLKPVWIRNFGG